MSITEGIRLLLETYPGLSGAPAVRTDLTGAAAPSGALSKTKETRKQDVTGRLYGTTELSYRLLTAAGSEAERRLVGNEMERLSGWLESCAPASAENRLILSLWCGACTLLEAYDNGTAVYQLPITAEWMEQ